MPGWISRRSSGVQGGKHTGCFSPERVRGARPFLRQQGHTITNFCFQARAGKKHRLLWPSLPIPSRADTSICALKLCSPLESYQDAQANLCPVTGSRCASSWWWEASFFRDQAIAKPKHVAGVSVGKHRFISLARLEIPFQQYLLLLEHVHRSPRNEQCTWYLFYVCHGRQPFNNKNNNLKNLPSDFTPVFLERRHRQEALWDVCACTCKTPICCLSLLWG